MGWEVVGGGPDGRRKEEGGKKWNEAGSMLG